VKRLEAICDTIAKYHNYGEPESEAYELRNPGLLLADTKNGNASEGKRVFSCHRAGYAALLDKVEKICTGHREESVVVLLETFGIKMKNQQSNMLDFMARCANSTGIKMETPLGWFLE